MRQKKFTFQDLKKRSATELERIRQVMSFNVGDWKRTRLETALGKRLAKATLLDDGKHQDHAKLMARRFQKRWGGLTNDQVTDQLRFLTILDSVIPVDTERIVKACEALERGIKYVLTRNKYDLMKIEIIGCVELEIVNLSHTNKKVSKTTPIPPLLRRTDRVTRIAQALQVQSSFTKLDEAENEQRKLNVLRAMREKASPHTLYNPIDETKSWVLIHFHGLVHLRGSDEGRDALYEWFVKKLRRYWKLPYAVELKKTFERQGNRKKFGDIADYITKGGNPRLRYETQFGQGTSDIDMTERAMWKQGYRGVDSVDGRETWMEDSIGLTVGEIEVLGKSIYRLMKRNSRGDGYVIDSNRFKKSSRFNRRRC